MIGTRFFNDEGSTEINGAGRFLWFVDAANPNLCDDNFSTVSGGIENVVWPVMRDSDTPYIPNSSIYNRDGTQDTIERNGEDFIRIWNFDDTNSLGDSSAPCDGALVCTRPGSSQNEEVPTLTSIIDNRAAENIDRPDDEIPEMEYKTFKIETKVGKKNGKKKLYIASCIDTINPEENCKSENQDINDSNWDWKGPYT